MRPRVQGAGEWLSDFLEIQGPNDQMMKQLFILDF